VVWWWWGDEWLVSCSGCFTTRKEQRYTLNRRMDGPQSLSEWFREEKYCSPFPGWNPGTSNTHPGNWTVCCVSHTAVITMLQTNTVGRAQWR
jgi:hypothetical protein